MGLRKTLSALAGGQVPPAAAPSVAAPSPAPAPDVFSAPEHDRMIADASSRLDAARAELTRRTAEYEPRALAVTEAEGRFEAGDDSVAEMLPALKVDAERAQLFVRRASRAVEQAEADLHAAQRARDVDELAFLEARRLDWKIRLHAALEPLIERLVVAAAECHSQLRAHMARGIEELRREAELFERVHGRPMPHYHIERNVLGGNHNTHWGLLRSRVKRDRDRIGWLEML